MMSCGEEDTAPRRAWGFFRPADWGNWVAAMSFSSVIDFFLKNLLKYSWFIMSVSAQQQSDSVTHILFHILSHYGLLQDIEYNSLFYTGGHCLSTLSISLPLLTPKLINLLPSSTYPPPWQPQVLFCESIFVWYIAFCLFLISRNCYHIFLSDFA